jgi:hypothetical protein
VPKKSPTNNTRLYNALVEGLLRPEVRYAEAHYLDFTLPSDDAYEGGSGQVNDYLSYNLAVARELRRKRRNKGDAPVLTQADRQDFLRRGLACLQVRIDEDQTTRFWAIARPKDMAPRSLAMMLIAKRARETEVELVPDQPFVYDTVQRLYVPDPFTEPHLLALYRYLNPQ